MKHLPPHLRLGLEDLLGDLWHARRREDLGRLALLSYYEVRRWARVSGKPGLVEHSSVLITGRPLADRASFLEKVDLLIAELERVLDGDRSQQTERATPASPPHRDENKRRHEFANPSSR